MDTSTIISVIAGSFVTTSSLFLIIKRLTAFKNPTTHHWAFIRRWFMLSHTLVTTTLTTLCIVTAEDFNHSNTVIEELVASIMIGHFMFDFMYVSYHFPDWVTLMHHSLLFLWFPISLIYKIGGMCIVIGVFLVNLSDVLLHVRALVTFLNQKFTWLFFIVEFLFFAGFFAGPLVFGPFATAKMFWFREHNEWFLSIGFYGLYVQKLYLCWDIRTLIARRYSELMSLRNKKEQIPWMNPIKLVIPTNN